jgi:hypothetical protein
MYNKLIFIILVLLLLRIENRTDTTLCRESLVSVRSWCNRPNPDGILNPTRAPVCFSVPTYTRPVCLHGTLLYKSKVEDRSKTDCVYQIPCKTFNIGETGRTFGTRLDEHKKDVEMITIRRFTWEKRKCSTNVKHESATSDHADRYNYVTNWEE